MYQGKGGCSKNPYGGLINTARIDWVDFVASIECIDSSEITGARLLALTQLSHVYPEYMFYGLEKNGYQSVTKFFEAVEFFFRTRSFQPETWKHSPSIAQVVMDETTGKRIAKRIAPPPETLQLQCFDKWYEVAEMDKVMPMERFLEQLKTSRRSLLIKSLERVQRFLDFCRNNGLPYRTQSDQLAFIMESPDYLEALVCPSSPEEIEHLLLPTISLEWTPPKVHRPYFPSLWKRRRNVHRKVFPAAGQGSFVRQLSKGLP